MIFKQRPEDFIVQEVLHLPLGQGEYSYFLLKKKEWSTLDVVERLEKFLGTNVGFAGNKDKHAVTEQFISVLHVPKKRVEQFQLPGVSLEFIGKGKRPISLGMLEGNKFKILLREVNRELPQVDFIENYFDEQRFGKHNCVLGKILVQRKFKEASALLGKDIFLLSKKRLRFYLSAYQSYLFNAYLRMYLKKNASLKVSYSLGEFFFVKKIKKNFQIPLVSFDSEIDKIYAKLLKKEGLTPKDFLIREIPDLISETSFRDAFVPVQDFQSTFFKEEKKQVVSFYLQKGSYATIVIKKMLEIFKYK